MSQFLTQTFLGNSYGAYAWAIIVFALIFVILNLAKNAVLNYLKRLAKKTKIDLDDFLVDAIKKISNLFLLIVSLYFALKPLKMPEQLAKLIHFALVLVIAYEIVMALHRIIDYAVKKIISKKKDDIDGRHIIKVSGLIVKILIWLLALVAVLSSLGFNVTSLVAGLGIGGVALAFGVQSILQDLFSAFSIYIDRPFAVGDFITSGDYMGVVKKVGMKNTRITALQGEEIIISNKDLTGAPLQNFKKMTKRRVEFNLGVTYETKLEKLKKVPEMVRDIIKKTPHVEFDRAHFKSYGDFSLNFEIVYYALTGDYNKYMDIQQEINFAIFEAFEKEGIVFAYPTQTLYINK